jgi:hypothetical protein
MVKRFFGESQDLMSEAGKCSYCKNGAETPAQVGLKVRLVCAECKLKFDQANIINEVIDK